MTSSSISSNRPQVMLDRRLALGALLLLAAALATAPRVVAQAIQRSMYVSVVNDAGVPKDQIVLAFRPPEVRPYTGFAVA